MPDIADYLKDIHVPGDVSSWPLAIGWWIAVLLGIVFIILVAWFFVARKNRGAWYIAKKEVTVLYSSYKKNLDASEFLRKLSIIMRRYCLSYYPPSGVAGLAGQPWLQFLDQGLKGRPFTDGPGKVLATAPYQREVDINVKNLYALCIKRIEAGVK